MIGKYIMLPCALLLISIIGFDYVFQSQFLGNVDIIRTDASVPV